MRKKIIAFISTFAILTSLLSVPVFAAENPGAVGVARTFIDWVSETANSTKNLFKEAIFGSGTPTKEAYDVFVSDLNTNLGTSTIGYENDGRWYVEYVYMSTGASGFVTNNGTDFVHIGGSVTEGVFAGTGSNLTRTIEFNSAIIAPFSGTYSTFCDVGLNPSGSYDSANIVFTGKSNQSITKGSSAWCANRSAVDVYVKGTSGAWKGMSFDLRVYAHFYPLNQTLPELYPDSDIGLNSRPTSLVGDLYYGETVYKDPVIVNEGDSTYYNPVTNTTYDMTGWTYDYSDRSYHITTEDNSVTVTYGDEYLTINEGDTIYNINYYVEGAGSGGSGEGGGDTDSDGILDLVLKGVLKIFDTVGKIVGTLFAGLIDLINSALSGLSDILSLFGSFGEVIAGLFGWLPEELRVMIGAAISLVLMFGLLKLILK